MVRPKPTTRREPEELRRCENTTCRLKISPEKVRKGKRYCDDICERQHREILKRAEQLKRRPKNPRCHFCTKPLDPMSREPNEWERSDKHFCDQICATAYHRENGHFDKMSKKGNEAVRQYKQLHGKIPHQEDRATAVSENNKKAAPKAKWHPRQGTVWGYEVVFRPKDDDTGYHASIPELPELGTIDVTTVRAGLLAFRQKMAEDRIAEREKHQEEIEQQQSKITQNREYQRRRREKLKNDPIASEEYRRYQREYQSKHWEKIKNDPKRMKEKRKSALERYHRKKNS